MRRRCVQAAMAALCVLLLGACKKSSDDKGPVKKGGDQPTAAAGGTVELQGAGATFPYPLYSKWVAEYEKVAPNVRINYQSIGSGGGIRQIIEKTVDFGASDAPVSDEQLAKAPGKLLHIPTTLGAVVVAYNLPKVKKLDLDPETVSGIFLGTIKSWKDPKIAALNPGVELPDQPISVVHRSDGSGTTNVFTDYLSKISPDWKDKVGVGTSVEWPTGLGAKGNEGVAGQVKGTPGSVGYIELAYAIQTNQPYALLKNKAGKLVEPSLEAISAAAAGVEMPADFRVSVTNAEGDDAYPIAAFTYLLVYQDVKDATKGKALADFLWWAIHDGQKYGAKLHYASLPPKVVKMEEATLKTLTANGKPLLTSK